MKPGNRHISLAVFFFVLAATCQVMATSDKVTDNEWRIYDVNGDGKFDVSDISEFTGNGGIGFINDLNRDGNKDLTDAFALYVRLSVLDRNCDEAVDDDDFTPVEPVELPEPDAAAVWPLVSRIVSEALKKLPPDIENQVFRSLPGAGVMTPYEKAYVFELTGMSALLQLNLEVPFGFPVFCFVIPGYCDGEPDISRYNVSMLNNTFSLDLWIASFESNYDTEAWEFRVGQGVFLGASWSPESGYGYQAGVDLGMSLVGAGFDAQLFLEVDKNGMHLNGEASAFVNMGILEAGIEKSFSHTLIPFQAVPNEPTPLSETE